MGDTHFEGKVAWIIGASSGIGRELAIQLDRAGASLILSARNVEALEKLKAELSGSHHTVLALDLETVSTRNSHYQQEITKVGRVDYLFNNGGISQRSVAFETPLEVDRKLMEINYFGNIALAKMMTRIWQNEGGGHIVVISSIAGKFGFFLRSAYSAAKHALHGFYESLRLEEEKNNIKVTIVCPGKINTPISTNAINAAGEKHGVMDHNQETGMSVELCVSKILKAVIAEKHEVLIGGEEIKAVLVKRFFPRLFHKIIRKQKAV
jgi:dehydrogenase/reductase SDR family protein 7B